MATKEKTKSGKNKNAKADKKAKASKPRANAMSLIDACAEVLRKVKKPLNAKEIVEEAEDRKLWLPGDGLTPHATAASAMNREIAKLGKESRFKKAGRGEFTATGSGGKSEKSKPSKSEKPKKAKASKGE